MTAGKETLNVVSNYFGKALRACVIPEYGFLGMKMGFKLLYYAHSKKSGSVYTATYFQTREYKYITKGIHKVALC